MFKKNNWGIWAVILIIVGCLFILWDYSMHKNGNVQSDQKSQAQKQTEEQLGEGIINLYDPKTKEKADIDFVNKKAKVDTDNGKISFEILDVLQPFNIDSEGDLEWPFLMRIDYWDNESIDYLYIARKNDDKFKTIDLVKIGDPVKVDDIHSVAEREVAIDCDVQINENSPDKERVILTYTFSDDKIIPGANNVNIDDYPQKKEEPTPTKTTQAKKEDDSGNVDTKEKLALSFDDGPGKHTPEILDILKDKNIKATFFMIGENVDPHADFAQRVHDEGHEIGNHTWDHAQLTKLSADAQKDEIQKASDAIKKAVGNVNVHWMRPPYGSFNDDTLNVLSSLGMEKMLWNVDTRDWSGKSAADIISSAVGDAKDGSIILMHDGVANSSETAKALPDIISGLQDKGFQMVTIGELRGL